MEPKVKLDRLGDAPNKPVEVLVELGLNLKPVAGVVATGACDVSWLTLASNVNGTEEP